MNINKIIFSAAFIGCIVGANWALSTFGLVPVGFGLVAPAGVFFAGLSFGVRDAVQEVGGRAWTVGLIVVGAALSALIDPQLALASGTAFLLGELADLCVYSPLRERAWMGAVVASNAVGSIVDSVVFLSLAGFGVTVTGVAGLVWGKLLMTVPAIAVVWFARNRRAAAT
jgi:uncharacterized PurR-regulated membrane protein YhhQ (DUF165 family)